MTRVVVFGSINMDVVAFAPRHPGAGETIKGSELHLLPGGKGANQAVAARRAGAQTALAGRLGDDAFAGELRTFLDQENIDLALTESLANVSTGTALITVAASENTIVVVPGANDRLRVEAVDAAAIGDGDVVAAQFETPQETTLAAFEKARRANATTVLNPAPAEQPIRGLLDATDVLVLNETELAVLSGESAVAGNGPDETLLQAASGKLRTRSSQIIIVTLGAAGAVVATADRLERIDGRVVEAVDTTGAGDCFVGNLAASLAEGASTLDAAARANIAASLCVQIVGAGVSMPSKAMVDEAAGLN